MSTPPRADDAYVMYLVVRKDHPLTTARAMALAGAGAARCARAFRGTEAWAGAFAGWARRARKVALRATEDELETLRGDLDAVAVDTEMGTTLLCLPPRRMSAREPLLAALAPFTDARRPAEPEPEPASPALTYVVRPGVLRTAGKAMAQAGHAALMCADELGPRRPEAFAAWWAAGAPGRVRVTDDEGWLRLKREVQCVVVQDAGLTQVAPGTETVLAVPPGAEPPLVAALEPLD